MDAREAREHLEMVDEILRRGECARGWSLRALGVSLSAMGVGAGLLDLGFQFSVTSGPSKPCIIAGIALLIAGLAYMLVSIALSRRNAERLSLAQIRTGRVMSAVWLSVFVAAFCQPHIFGGWSASAIWSLAGAIAMLINGFFGDRPALGGGIVLLASMLVANYVPAISGFALAGGFFIGYVGVGVMYLAGAGAVPDCE